MFYRFNSLFPPYHIYIYLHADTEIATALTWSPDCQLFSCSDDKIVCKWAADGSCLGKINTLNVFVTGISWYPATGKQVSLRCIYFILYYACSM